MSTKSIPITEWFMNVPIGEIRIADDELASISRLLISGIFTLAPAYIKHPDGSITLTELSLVPVQAAQGFTEVK